MLCAPPLTGIGRYSYELASRLAQSPRIARLRFFSSEGRWLANPLQDVQQHTGPEQARVPVKVPLWSRARSHLAQNRMAVYAYHMVAPRVLGWRLRGNAQALYHAPNYLVPPFAGRTIGTVHDLSHIRYPQFHPRARVDLLNLALPASLSRTDHVITISEATRQEFLALFPSWSPERISTIALAADAAFQPWPQDVVAPSLRALAHGTQVAHGGDMPRLAFGTYTLFVGTVEPRKNVDGLLSAYERLPAPLRQEFPLVIAGAKGWNSEHTHARMAQAQREGWLYYLSFVPQAMLPHLYAGAALMVYPSLYEGFGLPVVEAMASGVPVVTSSVSSMPEVAGAAARLVDPQDADALAQAIEQALSDAQWRCDARQRGLARAASFSWDRCAAETLAVYTRLQTQGDD